MTSPWSSIDYVELHCHSTFSLLDGTSAPEALIARAGDLGMDVLALTDHDALYSAVPWYHAMRSNRGRPGNNIVTPSMRSSKGRPFTYYIYSKGLLTYLAKEDRCPLPSVP